MPQTRSLALLAALVTLVAWTAPAAAQDDAHTTVVFQAVGEATPGDTVEVRAVATVEPGWHIYSTTETLGTPTKLALSLPPGVALEGGVTEPAPHREEIEFVGHVSIHRGVVTFGQRVRIPADAAGPITIPARLEFQACDDANTMCVSGEASGLIVVPVKAGGGTLRTGSPTFGAFEGGAFDGGGADDFGAAIPAADPEVVAAASLVRRGPGRVDLVVTLQVKDAWHIYATETPNGQPTTLTLDLPAGVKAVGPVREPPPHDETIELVGPVRVHRGAVPFVQPLEVPAGAEGEVKGTVAWQVCDDQNTMCISGEQAFAVPLSQVVDGPAIDLAPVSTAATGQQAGAPAAPDADLGALFLASIGLGLLMLLQPCTYPMIPITVSIFSKGKALPRRTTVMRAAIYAVGIVVSFVGIGALVQVAFGAAGQGRLNELATNPFVNLAIGLIFIYFAFSFFGYYELGLPAPLQRLMQLGAAKRESDGTVPAWSLFLMGLFFVLTSYTCGAPIVLALFATSAQDPHPLAVVFATAVFATTVALPFFVLSLVPGAVRALPKSGSWFSVFKVVIGFLELGFALKFLRGADVIWELHVLSRPALLGLWTLLCLCAAVYLLGRFPLSFPHDPDLKAPSTGRGFWAAVFLFLAAYFGAGTLGRPLLEELEAFILAEHEKDGEGVRFGPLAYKTDMASLEAAKVRAKETGRPVFLMFTGHNCVNCALMEAKVLPQEEVVERIRDIPRVALFTDRGEEEKRHLAFMEQRFKTTVLPSFYLIDGDGNVLSAQNGGSDVATFVQFLERGGATK